MTDNVYWLERADGEPMGEYGGYGPYDGIDRDLLVLGDIEFDDQEDAQDDDPEGDHVVGVRIRVMQPVVDLVFASREDFRTWYYGQTKDKP